MNEQQKIASKHYSANIDLSSATDTNLNGFSTYTYAGILSWATRLSSDNDNDNKWHKW